TAHHSDYSRSTCGVSHGRQGRPFARPISAWCSACQGTDSSCGRRRPTATSASFDYCRARVLNPLEETAQDLRRLLGLGVIRFARDMPGHVIVITKANLHRHTWSRGSDLLLNPFVEIHWPSQEQFPLRPGQLERDHLALIDDLLPHRFQPLGRATRPDYLTDRFEIDQGPEFS